MIEGLVRGALKQRLVIVVIAFCLLAFGLDATRKLSVDAFPDVTNVQVQINTAAAGFSPLETEQRLTVIIENAMAGLPSLSYTRSLSRYGMSQVTVVFADGTDIYWARQQVAERGDLMAVNL